jgi:hypothetical protein
MTQPFPAFPQHPQHSQNPSSHHHQQHHQIMSTPHASPVPLRHHTFNISQQQRKQFPFSRLSPSPLETDQRFVQSFSAAEEIDDLRGENRVLKFNLEKKSKAYAELGERYSKREEAYLNLKNQLEALEKRDGNTSLASQAPKIDPMWMMLLNSMRKEVIEKNEIIERQKQELQAANFSPSRLVSPFDTPKKFNINFDGLWSFELLRT